MAIQHKMIEQLPDVSIQGSFSSSITGVSIDTRSLNAGDLFVAFTGTQVDGHDFIPKAISRGASAVMASTHWGGKDEWNYHIPLITSPDPEKSIADLAKAHRDQFELPLIGITGTNGKTSTKNLLAHILGKKHSVLSTRGNYNNQLGLPITLLGLNKSHDIAVIEMGASKPGDIAYLAQIASPTEGLITNISTAHTEFFNNVETIQLTKAELYRSVSERGGRIYVNADDPRVVAAGTSSGQIITYGFNSESDFNYSLSGPDEMGRYTLHLNRYQVHLPHPGKALALNAAAAVTVAHQHELDTAAIFSALSDYPGENGRMQLVQVGQVIFLHDAYNANPASTQAGLETVKAIKSEARKILVFGDMLELGTVSRHAHHQVAEQIISADFDQVFLLGIETIETAQHLDNNNFVNFYHNVEKSATLQKFLTAVQAGDLIYLKGSRSMMLEDFITAYKESI